MTIIGNQSRFSKSHADQANGQPKTSTAPHQPEDVHLLLDGALIEIVPLRLLQRFSQRVRKAFSGEAAHVRPKTLDLTHPALWNQPSPEAFKAAFAWMRGVAPYRCPAHDLPAFGPSEPDAQPLLPLIDLYAAAQSLEFCVFPRKLKDYLLGRLSNFPPLLPDLTLVHYHLPIEDIVMTRLLTSFVEHRGIYTAQQTGEFLRYINEGDAAGWDGTLWRRFKKIEAHHRQQQQPVPSGPAAAAPVPSASYSTPVPSTAPLQPAAAASTAVSQATAVAVGSEKGAQQAPAPAPATTPVVETQGNARGVGGRHVPGAS